MVGEGCDGGREDREKIVEKNGSVLERGVGEREDEFEGWERGEGKVWFWGGVSEERWVGN